MSVRIATFNAENLFRRPTGFGLDDERRKEIKEILEDFTELAGLLGKEIYEAADRERIAELIVKHYAHDSNADSRRPFREPAPGRRQALHGVHLACRAGCPVLQGRGEGPFPRSGAGGKPNRRRSVSASRERRW